LIPEGAAPRHRAWWRIRYSLFLNKSRLGFEMKWNEATGLKCEDFEFATSIDAGNAPT
jgi:hypothetical protein